MTLNCHGMKEAMDSSDCYVNGGENWLGCHFVRCDHNREFRRINWKQSKFRFCDESLDLMGGEPGNTNNNLVGVFCVDTSDHYPTVQVAKTSGKKHKWCLETSLCSYLNDFSVHFLVDFYWNEKKFFFVIKKSYLHKKSICVQCLSLSLHLKSNNHLSFNYVQEKRIVGGRKKTLFTDTTQECVSPQYTSLKFNFIFLP